MGMYPEAPGQYEYPAETLNRIPAEGWNAYIDEKWEPPKVVENLENLLRGWFGVTWHEELNIGCSAPTCAPCERPPERGRAGPVRVGAGERAAHLAGGLRYGLKPRLIICHSKQRGVSSLHPVVQPLPGRPGKATVQHRHRQPQGALARPRRPVGPSGHGGTASSGQGQTQSHPPEWHPDSVHQEIRQPQTQRNAKSSVRPTAPARLFGYGSMRVLRRSVCSSVDVRVETRCPPQSIHPALQWRAGFNPLSAPP